jgi:hypothetical protein
MARLLHARTTIKVVNQHRKKYKHQYARKKQPNSLVDVDGELILRINIVKNVATGTNITRTILAAAMKKDQKTIW